MNMEYNSLLLTEDAEPGTFLFRPARPSLARNENGTAQFSLIHAGSVSMLAFTAVWEAPASAILAARLAVAARLSLPPEQIRLLPQPLIASPAELRFGDGKGGWTKAVSTTSSGVAPFQAAFSLLLSPEQAACVHRALSGESGWMGVAYQLKPAHAPVHHSTLDAQASYSGETRLDSGDPEGATASLRAEATASVSAATSTTPDAPDATESFGDAAQWGLPPL